MADGRALVFSSGPRKLCDNYLQQLLLHQQVFRRVKKDAIVVLGNDVIFQKSWNTWVSPRDSKNVVDLPHLFDADEMSLRPILLRKLQKVPTLGFCEAWTVNGLCKSTCTST